jgi:glycosyltransferase involved in cell wall biosynthesis
MKIGIAAFFLNRTHSGGKEQVFFNLLRGFQALGKSRNIHIFAYEYSAGVIQSSIPDATFTFIPYKDIWGKKTLSDCVCNTFRLSRLLKEQHIGVLFFPHYNTGLKQFKIPTVVLPHDIQNIINADQSSLRERIIYGLQYYFDFKLRSKIIAISDYDRREIEYYYPQHKSKLTRIYNPIDTDFIPSTRKYHRKRPYICAINIAYVHKNTITLIKAFEKIMGLIEHNLLLVGRLNRDTEFLRNYVEKNHLGERVEFTGFLEDQELHRLLCQASLFVNPSLFEGFGMPAIEAAIRCIPVISSITGASPEVTRNLLNYYEPADDADRLAEKILEVLHTEPSPAKLEAIKCEYLANYAYTKISADYYEFLGELMNEDRG